MRITKIQIQSWRNFNQVEIVVPDEANLVCIVGANGTGKSHLLELISVCAERFGLSSGFDSPRTNPFNDHHSFSIQIRLPEQINMEIDQQLSKLQGIHGWDRTLTLSSWNTGTQHVFVMNAGGTINHIPNEQFADQVTRILRQSKSVYFLSLDANRAYPKRNLDPKDFASALGTDWDEPSHRRGRSHLQTLTLFEEWKKYFLARETHISSRHVQAIRKARQENTEEPVFIDPFESYREAIQCVLPHLFFTGIDNTKRTLLFNSVGLELNFDELSGGEREIAFLVSQIDRFGLQDGLLLLDEPELHLNADLIRTWVRYLSSTIKSGQIWLATHSLEVVETAGAESTFILERDAQTRKVHSVARLDTRPLIALVSRALGTPAFSISKVCFVFVEGEAAIGERERFNRLAGDHKHIRFIEGGAGTNVVNRVQTLRSVQSEAEAAIRIGGIVDRDFKQEAEIAQIKRDREIFVLPVHEVENYFLYPRTLEFLMNQHGMQGLTALDLIRESSDQRAGSWIFQYAMATPKAKQLGEVSSAAKEIAKKFTWQQFELERDKVIDRIKERWSPDANDLEKVAALLEIAVNAYARRRTQDDLWKCCEGKEVLNTLAPKIGFNTSKTMIQATFIAWEKGQIPIPEELQIMRDYLSQL